MEMSLGFIKVSVVIFSVFLAPIVWWYFSIRKFKSLDRIPGPKPVPILGNAKDIGGTPQEIFKNLNILSKKYNNLFKIYIGQKALVVVSESKIAEHILTSNDNITKSNGYDLVRPWIGDGLLLSTGQKWKSRRKMMTPSFHFEILKKFMTIFSSASDIFIEKLSEGVDKDYVDVFPLANLLALDIICETSMGVKVNIQQNQNRDYVKAVDGYFDVMFTRFFSAWRRFDILFKLFDSNYRLHRKYLRILHGFSKKVVEQKREEACREMSSPIENDKLKKYLLEMLLANPNLSDEDLREEVNTIMFAGHDTTTSAIAFALFALSRHPEIQANVYNEILETIGLMEQSVIAIEQIQSMKYLDMFLKEAQRMYPSIPMIERELDHDCMIDNIQFPKHTTVNIFIYGLHHRADYFPNPEKFDPLRFAQEKSSQRPNFSYVPFSAGPRNCIGQKFAVLETKMVIVKTLLSFCLLPVDYEPEMGMAAILKSCNGVRIKLKRR